MVLTFLLVTVSILLIGIILIQSGQGDMGSAMGGNTMNQAFGSQGADKLLVRITTGLAIIFMALAIFINYDQSDDKKKSRSTQSQIINTEDQQKKDTKAGNKLLDSSSPPPLK